MRVLNNGEYTPVGATKTRSANVRIIAATNHSLRPLVAAGGFREDLYHRLNVITLEIPPLRQHKEDLPLLLRSPWSEETGPERFSPCQPFNKQIAAFECRVIGNVLDGVDGNRAMASELLKIPLPTPIYHICLCHLNLPDEKSVRQNGLIYIESYFAAGCVIYSIADRPG